MQQFTNVHNVSLALAVWLVNDTYDYVPDERYISVTGLMRPLRQIILPRRINPSFQIPPDVTDRIASAMGTALHDSVEKAWTSRYRENLAKLGFPQDTIDRVIVNPSPEQLANHKRKFGDKIAPIYIEKRTVREFAGWKVGGKFDLVTNGVLQDNKSTSVYTHMQDNRADEYILQGSLYRWLNQDIITENFIRINFIFTDWTRREAKIKPDYPQHRVLHKEYPLWDIGKTEQWVAHRLSEISKYIDAPESEIPHCTDQELWLPPTQYKYYSDPAKADGGKGRSTRTFTDKTEANIFFASKGGKGVLLPIKGVPRRCDYCEAFPVCTQKDVLFND